MTGRGRIAGRIELTEQEQEQDFLERQRPHPGSERYAPTLKLVPTIKRIYSSSNFLSRLTRVYKIILPPRNLNSRCPVSIDTLSHNVQAMCYFNVRLLASK
jgi:hypothetical protein